MREWRHRWPTARARRRAKARPRPQPPRPLLLLLLTLLLALGALPAATAIACPSACSCYGTTTHCAFKALTAVPAGIDPLTTEL